MEQPALLPTTDYIVISKSKIKCATFCAAFPSPIHHSAIAPFTPPFLQPYRVLVLEIQAR